ncbi:MAG TPA: high-potential iron-sulfur protein, partial [Terriglobales bacterium]|nr:high-potential iron-sulfur protein [Terriglobales bacterium]
KLIDEQKDFSARALGFHHDGGKNPDRKDAKQRCENCKQYKKVAVMDGVDVGKCSLLAKGLVKSTGWCRSYLKDEALYKKA